MKLQKTNKLVAKLPQQLILEDYSTFSRPRNSKKWAYQGPAAKKINTPHIYDKHHLKGTCAETKGNKKTYFPLEMTDKDIEKCVIRAWRNGRKKIKTQKSDLPSQNTRICYKATDPKTYLTLIIWYNEATKIIETAYPLRN